jgi:hypothetical protein
MGDCGNIVRSVMEGQKIKTNAELGVEIIINVTFALLVFFLVLVLPFSITTINRPLQNN